jgi:hypothetical protein
MASNGVSDAHTHAMSERTKLENGSAAFEF